MIAMVLYIPYIPSKENTRQSLRHPKYSWEIGMAGSLKKILP
jgi:hypothetical protein